MIDYFEQAIRLLLGESFFQNFGWSEAFLEVALFFFAIIILYASFKLFKFLIFGWWR